jgi:hypothetical protein
VKKPSITLRYAESSDDRFRAAVFPQLSCPAPTIQLHTFEIVNLRPASDGWGLLADLHMAGELTDATGAYCYDAADPVLTLAVHLHGEYAPLTTIPLTPRIEPKSSAKSGDFVAPFDTVLRDVQVSRGWNSVRLKATNLCRFAGNALASFELSENSVGEVDVPRDSGNCVSTFTINKEVVASGGGVSAPFAIRVEGSEADLTQLQSVQLSETTWATVWHEGSLWLATEPGAPPSHIHRASRAGFTPQRVQPVSTRTGRIVLH